MDVRFRYFILLFFCAALHVSKALAAGGASKSCPTLFAETLDDDEKQVLEQSYGNFNAINLRSQAETSQLNEKMLAGLETEQLELPRGSKKKLGLSPTQIDELFADVKKLPQVRETVETGAYRGSPDCGFCWARALAVHMKALQAGLYKKSIRKIWIVGPLKSGDTHWIYHTATLVRSDSGAWFVLDPLHDRPELARDWYATMLDDLDYQKLSRIYITPANRYGVYSWDKYGKYQISHPDYKQFFDDLFKHELKQRK